MTKTKKLVCGTQRALDKQIEEHKAKGWTVERTEKVRRGQSSTLFTHIAYINR